MKATMAMIRFDAVLSREKHTRNADTVAQWAYFVLAGPPFSHRIEALSDYLKLKGPMMSKYTLVVVILFVGLAGVGCSTNVNLSVVDRPDIDRTNDFYVSNRPPLTPSPLIKLPVGAIEPAGWVRRQLELQADGFHGHLTEISRFLVKQGNAWLSPTGQGDHGWEEPPYWLKGFSNCGYVLGNE